MKRRLSLLSLLLAASCAPRAASPTVPPSRSTPVPSNALAPEPGERHFRALRQLTYGDGENAEAYWSFDGKALIMQSTRGGASCDRIWRIDDPLGTPAFTQVSPDRGRTTCSFFYPDGVHLLFSSTHAASPECPPKPDMSKGYVWALYDGYDIYRAKRDGSELEPLITGPGYDAEATICKDGSVVFTSTRDGDIDVYRADADGKHIRRLTDEPGYDGGAVWSPDCGRIAWRASRPAPGKELEDYRSLLKQGLVRPTQLEIWVMNADGSDKRKVTNLGAASFAPAFFPDGKRIIFASNVGDPSMRNFDLYEVPVEGGTPERITTYEGFDAFPMFSPDGKHLAFASNRHDSRPHETNVFVADWVE